MTSLTEELVLQIHQQQVPLPSVKAKMGLVFEVKLNTFSLHNIPQLTIGALHMKWQTNIYSFNFIYENIYIMI